MLYDVLIVGGGPAGLAAALTLGRSRKRVLVCDSGTPRNAAATHLQNFVTRDGTPPAEFRAIGREQLETYPSVEVRDTRVASISGSRGAFQVALDVGSVEARRVLVCTGMIDEPAEIEGMNELWGTSVFQCPYCHGWEVQDRRWGYLLHGTDASMLLPFAAMMRGWTSDVVVFTGGELELPADTVAQLEDLGVQVEPGHVSRLGVAPDAGHATLSFVELDGGAGAPTRRVPCDVLFSHPPQRQVPLVQALGVDLDEHGFVRVDAMTGETSTPGIYAAGDLTTRMQSAIGASAMAARTAAMINHQLAVELVTNVR